MDKQISHYKILSKIASGGMAIVYLALDTRTNTKVAVKLLKEEISGRGKTLERFTQEGLFNLNHPNIVKILDAGLNDDIPFIAMEYIEGRDLENLIRTKKKLSVNESLSIFGNLLSALAYVHSKGMVHRDIKPKNILIDKSGKVKLTDFGIAKSLYSHVKTSTGGYLGAPAYSSPEQLDGQTVDNRTDIYSLGITLYEMLTGVNPFSSKSIPDLINEKFTGKYRQIGTYRSDVPPQIISIVSKCIAVNPKDRFARVEEIINALNKSYNAEPRNNKTVPKLPGSTKKTALISSIAAILMLIIIIILVIKFSGSSGNNSPAVTKNSTVETIEARTTSADAASAETIALETTSPQKAMVETTVPASTPAQTAANYKIGFVSNRDGNYEIYIMNSDGSGQTRLTDNPSSDFNPCFSPDGSKIAFRSDRNGNMEIYLMNADGSEQTRLTNNPREDWNPSFFPDGSKIAFQSDRNGNLGIYSMNTDGSDQAKLTNSAAGDGVLSFSPDGSKIVFCSDSTGSFEIFTINTNGFAETRITNNQANDLDAAFSPDGSKIAFSSDRDENFDIYMMNSDGSLQTKLVNNLADDGFPTFSPDGSKIAFTSNRDGNDEIYIMNLDGSEQTRLTNNSAGNGDPAFSFIQ